MNLETSSSHTDRSSYNPETQLIPENVKGNPHMFRGWREGLLWALINPQLLQQFDIETGCDLDLERGGIGSFISPERGFMVCELSLFVAWYNRTIWDPGK